MPLPGYVYDYDEDGTVTILDAQLMMKDKSEGGLLETGEEVPEGWLDTQQTHITSINQQAKANPFRYRH